MIKGVRRRLVDLGNVDAPEGPLKIQLMIFNKEYIPHLSRIKEVAGGVPEPGRSFNLSLKYDF